MDDKTATTVTQVPDNVKQVAKDLAYDVCYHISGLKKRKPPCKHADTMRRTVEEMFTKHEILFNSMLNKLQLSRDTVSTTLYNIATEIFQDKQYNWGRVVSVYAFGARLSKYFGSTGDVKAVEKVASAIYRFTDEKLCRWIHENGGWDAFDDHFPEEKRVEDAVWNALLFTAIGLGALATMVAVR